MSESPAANGRILATLKSTFGHDSFRPLQEGIVRATLAGRDVFVLMPTGGGKSLCYQLPALLMEGVAVVVSPLIALMKDQVDALQALGVPALFINSSLEPAEIRRREAAVSRGRVKLLYVAPERLTSAGMLHLLSSVRVSFFAVDEAHCISEWGHDFRPEYRELGRLRELFPSTPLGAFTATATQRVRADIKGHLRLQRADSFLGSFNRPNLLYRVWPKRSAYRQLAKYLHGRRDASGIVYCFSRAGTDDLAARLQADGFSAVSYHAGLESDERRRRQEDFVYDRVRIIVATIAFGMGIDKPDVRFVVHHDLPRNLESYYQESGRAGRDGDSADCILFFSAGDVVKQEYFLAQKESPHERQVATQQLRRMVEWATGLTCRRRTLLAYFDETLGEQPGPCCDLCATPREEVDLTVPAQMYLSCALRAREGYDSDHLIQVLRGSRAGRVVRAGHDRLSTYGIGKGRSTEEWRHLAGELLRLGYTRVATEEYDSVRVTERGRAVLFKGERVILSVPKPVEIEAEKGASAAAPEIQFHQPLFDRLRELRKGLADERGVPPYVLFHDSTLRAMAAVLPADRAELLRLPGVGERKAADFGEAFLAAIDQYVRETGATPMALPAPTLAPRRTAGELGATVRATLDLYRQGRSVEEIAAARQLAAGTVWEHMTQALEAGEAVEVDRLVPDERRLAAEAAMAEVGTDRLRPVMDLLGEGYSYGELKIVRAALLRRERESEASG